MVDGEGEEKVKTYELFLRHLKYNFSFRYKGEPDLGLKKVCD